MEVISLQTFGCFIEIVYLCTEKCRYNIFFIMAKPIKETPVLVGSEAIRLAKKIDNPRVVTSQEVIQARDAYNAVMSIAKFQF